RRPSGATSHRTLSGALGHGAAPVVAGLRAACAGSRARIAGMIDALQQLHLLRPHWLWALALLPVLAWMSRRRAMQASAWREAVDTHLLPHLIETRPVRRERVATWLSLLAAALAIGALAGPS